MTLNHQNKGFQCFFKLSAAAHILRLNCAQMAGDVHGQPAYEIFST